MNKLALIFTPLLLLSCAKRGNNLSPEEIRKNNYQAGTLYHCKNDGPKGKKSENLSNCRRVECWYSRGGTLLCQRKNVPIDEYLSFREKKSGQKKAFYESKKAAYIDCHKHQIIRACIPILQVYKRKKKYKKFNALFDKLCQFYGTYCYVDKKLYKKQRDFNPEDPDIYSEKYLGSGIRKKRPYVYKIIWYPKM